MLSINDINELVAELQMGKQELMLASNQYNSLLKQYNEVLSLAKRNADSNEYCIQELEKENEQLKKQIKDLEEMYCIGG